MFLAALPGEETIKLTGADSNLSCVYCCGEKKVLSLCNIAQLFPGGRSKRERQRLLDLLYFTSSQSLILEASHCYPQSSGQTDPTFMKGRDAWKRSFNEKHGGMCPWWRALWEG